MNIIFKCHKQLELLPILMLLALLIPACQPASVPVEEATPSLPVQTPAEITTEAPEPAPAVPTISQQNGDTDIQTPTAAVEAAVVNSCLGCHTDKEALVDSAKAVEVVESESSGEG